MTRGGPQVSCQGSQRVHPVARQLDQRRERLAVPTLRPDDEISHERSLMDSPYRWLRELRSPPMSRSLG